VSSDDKRDKRGLKIFKNRLNWPGVPAFTWFFIFVFLPTLIVLVLSFMKRGTYGGIEWQGQWENYGRLWDTTYFKIFWESLKLASSTATLCFLLGFPVAWAIATVGQRWRNILLLMIAIPFLTNLMIRVYAIKVLMGQDGPIQWLLASLGIPFDPFQLSQNKALVIYGMTTTYLPFMVFPLYSALEKFDFGLVEAAQDLRASSWTIATKIILPNIRQGVANGLILVFVPCMGEFVIPDLLGGAKVMLLGNVLTEQFLKFRHWPFGAAISCFLIMCLLFFPWLINRLVVGNKKLYGEKSP